MVEHEPKHCCPETNQSILISERERERASWASRSLVQVVV
jgi:hypothetical protein